MGSRLWILTLTLFFLSSCAATQSTDGAGSISKNFGAPFSSVTAAARHSVETLNVTVTGAEQVGDVFMVNFKKPASAWSWGEVGWVKVYPSGSGQVTVEVSSKKVVKVQRTGTEQDEFAEAIFGGIEKSLREIAND